MVNLIYIKLKNFEALPICMGRDEIEIDRSDSPNNIVLIKGQNGSGKSTLLQELTPFAMENTISRNSRRVMKGKEGLKELHFLVDNRFLYNCRIIYTDKKTSAYISKQDLMNDEEPEELNPNGNISTYEDVLENELGIKKSYQKIGYLSPDIVNFISMKAAERSHYVSSIMPDISIYLKGYEIVSKKANEKKREIDNINKELGKLSTINYENHLNELKNRLDNLDTALDKTKSDITKCEVYINNLEKYKYDFDKLNEMMREHDLVYHNLEIDRNKIMMSQELISKYNGKDSNEKLNNDIKYLSESLTKNREREYQIEQRIEKLTLSIREKSSQMDLSEIKDSLDDIINYIDKYQIDLKEMELLLEKLTETNTDLIDLFNGMETNVIYEFSRIMDLILDYSNKIENNQYDLIAMQNEIDILQKNLENIILNITDKEKELNETIEKISLLKSNEEMNQLYALKPAACLASTCKIIQELEKYINVSNERELLIKHKELLENTKSNENKKKEDIENKLFNIKQNLKILVSINDYLHNNANIIASFSDPLKEIFKKELNIIIERMKNIKLNFNSFREYIHVKDKVNVLKNSLNELKIKKNTVITKNNLNKEVEELDKEKQDLMLLRDTINKQMIEKESLEKISETKLKIEKDIENYNKNILNLKTFGNNILSYSKIKYYYNHLKDIYIKLQCDKSVKEREKQELEKERETLKTEYLNKQQLETLRNNLLDIKKKYDILSSVWSAKTGYPSILMENFLLKLKEETNQDLAEIWDNSLAIEDFVLSQTEFSIVMNKNGTIIPDASQCSQGEKAILSLALSFAIIEMGLNEKKYNVVRMDEADGPLDTIRARFFLTMLQNRLKKMNNATAFVITHKDEFDEVPADMILLRNTDLNIINSETNKNKNIIFKL